MSKKLWDIQYRFTEKALKAMDKPLKDFTEEDIVKWTKEYLLYISKEGFGILDELNWKKHSKEIKNPNKTNIKVDLIDMQKYLWGLMIINGISYNDFEETFKDKSYEVEKKWAQNFELKGVNDNKKNCIIDIDGVLNYYPECFFSWVEANYSIDKESLLSNKVAYEKYKDLYRSSGFKRFIAPRISSVGALRELKSLGYSIILMTNRPNLEYKNMFVDTVGWLDDNKIPYDYLYWSRGSKIVDVFNKIENVKFIIDDSPEICTDFRNMGIKAYTFSEAGDKTLTNIISSIYDIAEIKEKK